VERDNFTFIIELCHVTVLINNAMFHTPALSPNSSAFHTSPPPTTSLCHKPPCHLTIAPPLSLPVYTGHPYLYSGAAMCLRQVDPEDDCQHGITLQKTTICGNTAVRTSHVTKRNSLSQIKYI
jgi:hypothetical protein